MEPTLKLSGKMREIPIHRNDPQYCQYVEDNETHDWIYVGSAPDGTAFYKCRCCGFESEGM